MHNNFFIRNNYKNIIPFNLKKNKLRVHANIIGNKTTSLHGFYIGNEIKFWYYYFGINGLKKDNTILIKQFWNKKLSVFFISNFNMIEGKWGFSKIYEQYYDNYLFIKNIKLKLFKMNLILYNNYSNYLNFFNLNLNINIDENLFIKKRIICEKVEWIFEDDLLYGNRKKEIKINNKNISFLSLFYYKNILFSNININNNLLNIKNYLFKFKKDYKLPISYKYNFDNLQNFMKNIFNYEYNLYFLKKKKNLSYFYNNINLNFLKNYKKFIWNFNLIKQKKNLNINKNKYIFIKKQILLKFLTIKKIFNLMQFYKLFKIIKNLNKNNIISLFYKFLLFFKFLKFKFNKNKKNNDIKQKKNLIKLWYIKYKTINDNKNKEKAIKSINKEMLKVLENDMSCEYCDRCLLKENGEECTAYKPLYWTHSCKYIKNSNDQKIIKYFIDKKINSFLTQYNINLMEKNLKLKKKKKFNFYKKIIIKLFINKLFINKYIKNLLRFKKNLLRFYKKKLLINNNLLIKKKKNLNYKLLNEFSFNNIKSKKFNKLNFFNNINININEMEYSNIFWWKFKKINILRRNNTLLLQQKF